MLVCWAGVIGFGANQAIVADLFQDVGGPASDTADGKGRGEEVAWQADGGEQYRGIKLDIGVETATWFLLFQKGNR